MRPPHRVAAIRLADQSLTNAPEAQACSTSIFRIDPQSGLTGDSPANRANYVFKCSHSGSRRLVSPRSTVESQAMHSLDRIRTVAVVRAGQPRAGAAAVEFAIVLPVFLLLLGGIIEFGQGYMIEHSLSNAARRGSRKAALPGVTNTQVESLVKTHCVNTLKVAAGDVTVGIKVIQPGGAESTDFLPPPAAMPVRSSSQFRSRRPALRSS